MTFLLNILENSIGNIPSVLLQQAHNADNEYGVRGGHAKPCRACNDFKSWIQINKSKHSDRTGKPTGAKPETNLSLHSKECPLDKDELGRNSWSLLHTMAAYYPEKPSDTDQTMMKNFIQAFAKFYPCESCASDFRRDISEDPPDTTSQSGLSNWWCRMHNRVNRKLSKPEFDCSKINERWLDGWKDGSCD